MVVAAAEAEAREEKPKEAGAWDDEAAVNDLVGNDKETMALDEAAVLVTPKPVNELAAPEEVAEGAEDAAMDKVVAAEELKLKAGMEKDGCAVLVAAGVEALVVVTVENKGATEVENDREVGFAAVVPGAEDPSSDAALLILNPKED